MELNNEQQKIVDSNAKNILVLACPGSGKTYTVIQRYINLVTKNNKDPNKIILITFTKKAGMELKKRIEKYIPDKLPYYVGTLHSLAFKVLRDNGYTNTILDEDCNKEFIAEIVEELEPYHDKKEKLKDNLSLLFDKFYFNPDDNPKKLLYKSNFYKERKLVLRIFDIYKQRKKEQNVFSFCDLMVEFKNFLNSEKGSELKELIEYVFFDEYQDINKLQEKILFNFYKHSNIMVVGDICQSIYNFRGSDISNINNFKNKYKKAKVYKLSTNYRSTKQLVKFNKNILEHPYYSMSNNKENSKGRLPKIIKVTKDKQYKYIAKDINKKIKKYKCKFSDFSILSRKRNITVSGNKINKFENLKKIFSEYHIPSVERSNLSLLLEKYHIVLFIALVIVKNNNKSKIHWKKILSCLPDLNISLVLANDNILEYLKESEYSFIYKYMTKIDKTEMLDKKVELYLSLFKLLLHSDKQLESYVKDIKNLLSLIESNEMTLLEYINEFYLSFEQNLGNNVVLDTIHGSKGLEWKFVYIIDCDDAEFTPFNNHYNTEEDIDFLLEEERRLLYVGCTRAKRRLIITHTHTLCGFIK